MKIKKFKYIALILFILIGCFYSILLIKNIQYENEESHKYVQSVFEVEIKKIRSNEHVIDNERAIKLILLALDRQYENKVISLLLILLISAVVGVFICLFFLVVMGFRLSKLKEQLK